MKVYLETLGCRLNESEIERIGRGFRYFGHEIVSFPEEADLGVFNTCAVTNEAGRKSRQLIYQALRRAPHLKVVVTGCYSEIEREKVEKIDGVLEVVSNLKKDELVQHILGLSDEQGIDLEPMIREAGPGELGRTRAFLKIQDGCDNHCTFCVTKVARGRSRSRSLEEIITEVKALHEVGYQEIVLSGVNLGSYGRDLSESLDLKVLIEALLERTSIPRIRLSSLEPWDIPDNFFELWKDSRLCRHFHLPLQSGCDRTLKRMARRTRRDSFRELVAEMRSKIPNVAISSDMIVGFPGETEEDFERSLAFFEEMNFCHAHIFRYSVRPKTAAARMSHQVSSEEKIRRSKRLQELARRSKRAFYRSVLGQEVEVLWEQRLSQKGDEVCWQGLTDHYVKVITYSKRDLYNKITPVRLESLEKSGEMIQVVLL